MSNPRLGRADLRAATARSQATASRQYLGVGLPERELALPQRPLGPKYRAAALAFAAQQLAAELATLPRALDVIAKRVQERLAPAPQPGDGGLLEDLSRLRERAGALSLEAALRDVEAALRLHFNNVADKLFPYAELVDAIAAALLDNGGGLSARSVAALCREHEKRRQRSEGLT